MAVVVEICGVAAGDMPSLSGGVDPAVLEEPTRADVFGGYFCLCGLAACLLNTVAVACGGHRGVLVHALIRLLMHRSFQGNNIYQISPGYFTAFTSLREL